jgi:bacillithiol system protein YtxJ
MKKLIFKHSYRCSVSVFAKAAVDKFLSNFNGEIDFTLIDVIKEREKSNGVAEKYKITHQSPQVIIIDDENKVIWSGSHSEVTEINLIKYT